MRLIFMNILLVPLFLWACATATSTAGRDFDSSKVSQIQKGVTTTSQILSWFGEPYDKGVVSATEEKWHYGWARATANATTEPFFGARTIETKGIKKNLWLFIKDDIVLNYTFEEGPFERSTKSRQGLSQ